MFSRVRVRSTSASTGMTMALAAIVLTSNLNASSAEAQVRSNAQADQNRALAGSNSGRTQPPTGRYASETGENFIFDRSGERPLFRFERRQETWVLRPTPAPRGDIIYRNDEGTRVLRVSPEGGMTLYTVRAPNGTPASMVGPATSLALPVLGPEKLFQLMAVRSGLITRALGRTVEINLYGDKSEALCVEALIISTDAVLRMARSATMRDRLTRLRSITIVEGGRMSATFSRGELRIVVNPAQGISGRPSSSRIIRAFEPTQ